MHARDPWHEAEYAVVGARYSSKQIQDRKRDCRKHTVENSDTQDRRGGKQRKSQFATAEACQSTKSEISMSRSAAYTTSAPSAADGKCPTDRSRPA